MSADWKLETVMIRVGQEPDPTWGSTVPPIHMTSTFTMKAVGVFNEHEYTRVSNPTRSNYERVLARLEGAGACVSFSSGMAAITAVLHTLRPGDGVVGGRDVYGGTLRLFEEVFRPWGLEFAYATEDTPAGFEAALKSLARPKLVWVETPTNPLLNIMDIAAMATLAHDHKSRLLIDNTFASPYLQQPLSLGADIVLHSVTKYLGGHSDVVGGAIMMRTEDDILPVRDYQKNAGAIPSAFDCWLVQRGIKTLAVRMERHCDNAEAFARALDAMPEFEHVIYPGLESHPQRDIARSQMKRFGGMVALKIRGGDDAALAFLKNLKIIQLAESLGGVESLAGQPKRMSHASLTDQERAERGIEDGHIRVSIGIENIDDLLGDVRAALKAAGL